MKKIQILNAALVAGISLIAMAACKKDRTIVYVDDKKSQMDVLQRWKPSAPVTQSFTLDATAGGMVVGAKGSTFYFPVSCFIDNSGNTITGNVHIELREYMTKGEMLFSGITVTSGNQLLESGGMFYLVATQDGKELKMRPGSNFVMRIPQSSATQDVMDFWNGLPNNKDSLNKIDWVKVDSVQAKPQKDSGNNRSFYYLNFNYFKFGYCNIDREWSKFKTFIKKFRIKMPDGCGDTNSTALLLFKNYNCCAWCNWLSDENRISTNYQLPLGETIKVLVYKKTGQGEDDLAFAIQEVVLTDDTEVVFSAMTPCTNQQLEDLIKAL